MTNGNAKMKRTSNTKQQTVSGAKSNEGTKPNKAKTVTRSECAPAPTSTSTSTRKATASTPATPQGKTNLAKPDVLRQRKISSTNETRTGLTKNTLSTPSSLPRKRGDAGQGLTYACGSDAPLVEDLERKEDVVALSIVASPHVRQLLPEPVRKTANVRGGGQGDTGVLLAGGGGGGGVETMRRVCSGRESLFAAARDDTKSKKDDGDHGDNKYNCKAGGDEDEEEEDDEEGDEEEDDDDEEEDDDDEDDDEEDDEEEDDDEDEDDDGGAVTRKRRQKEQITVKISREGDRNVKIIYITRSTKFMTFAKIVKRRFGYVNLSDFDMYCIDAAGDHVDIDVSQDFETLIKEFLQTLQRERDCTISPKKTQTPQLVTQGQRFSARGTLLGSTSLSGARRLSNEINEPLFESSFNSDKVLRLFVRDSYKTRQQEEQRGMYNTPSSGVTQGKHILSHGQSFSNANGLVTGDLSSDVSKDRNDLFSAVGSTISMPFNYTTYSLAMSLGFREDEELQWSKMALLGKGSFGSVYEGITSEGKIMAVKVLDIPMNENIDELQCVQREINLMKSLKHQNIVAYYGCQTKTLSNGMQQLEIFLEHCHGGSLSHLRRKFERAKERFSISLVRSYTKQILEGLCYLHSMNVVHRDLKSDNVLISALGEAKLADFGCSKRLGTATINQTGDGKEGGGVGYQTMVGTPLFMAPEVLSCDGSYTKAADVWSVGCLVLEMLGRQPWIFKTELNAFQIMYHISKSTSLPTGVPKNCPVSLLGFFTRCFEHDPKKRATAGQLLSHEWITCPDNMLQEVLDD